MADLAPPLRNRSFDSPLEGAVRSELGLPFVFEDLGKQQVKNIARPVRVDRVSAAAIVDRSPGKKAPRGIGAVQTFSGRHINIGVDGIVEMSEKDAFCLIPVGWTILGDA